MSTKQNFLKCQLSILVDWFTFSQPTTIKSSLLSNLLRVPYSTLTPSLPVPAHPSHCLPGLSAACRHSCEPCPCFLVLTTSAYHRAVDPRSPCVIDSYRSYCTSIGSDFVPSQLARPLFSRSTWYKKSHLLV